MSLIDLLKHSPASSTIIVQLFDPLFLRKDDGSVEPALAQSYTVSEDRKIYTVELKPNIKFHDDSLIEATDVQYSIERVIRISKLSARDLDQIEGVKELRTGKVKSAGGIEIVSPSKLRFHLLNPMPQFPQILANLTLGIVSKDARKGQIVGSGAYRFVSSNPKTGEVILARANSQWRSKPSIEKIIYRVVSDENDAKKMLDSHSLDNTHPFHIDLHAQPGWNSYEYLHTEVRYLGFNLSVKSTQSVNVRMALLSILPMDEIHSELNRGKEYPVSHFVPYGLSGYIPTKWKAPLPRAEAIKILKAQKWTSPIELSTYLPDTEIIETAKKICPIWNENGVSCRFSKILLKDFISRTKAQANHVFIGKLMPHIPDSAQLLTFFRSDLPLSFFSMSDPEIDRLLDKVRELESLRERAAIYKEVNQTIFDHYVAIPLKYAGRQVHYVRRPFVMPPVSVVGPYFIPVSTISAGAGK